MKLIDGHDLLKKITYASDAHRLYDGNLENTTFTVRYSDLCNAVANAHEIKEHAQQSGDWIYSGYRNCDGTVNCVCSICGADDCHSVSVMQNGGVNYCWKCGSRNGY